MLGFLQALFIPDTDINSAIDLFLLLLFFNLLFLLLWKGSIYNKK